MRLINWPVADNDTGAMLRRLLATRASRDGKRVPTRPLTDARIRRVAAVASSALADPVPATLPANPAAGVKTGRHRRVKPLLWTHPRVERWRQTGEIPGRVMVWIREQCGAFLDSIEGERLYATYHLAAYFGLRRSEVCGLMWADAGRRGADEGDQRDARPQHLGVLLPTSTPRWRRNWPTPRLRPSPPMCLAAARSLPVVPFLCRLGALTINETRPGTRTLRRSPWPGAEARGFEPRMGANPNRISSPFAAAKDTVKLRRPSQSAQVSGVVPGKATEAAAGRRDAAWAISGPSQTLLQRGPPHARERIRLPLVTHTLYRKDNPR